MSISVLSVNARGIRDELKRKSIYLYCQNKCADFYFLQETHASDADLSLWRSQWGKDLWLSCGSHRSAGVAVLLGRFKGHVIKCSTDREGRWIILIVVIDHQQFILVNVYASNNRRINMSLFATIENNLSHLIPTFPEAKILWGGDFNTVMDESMDRWPPKDKKTNELENICNRIGLIDIWRHRHLNGKAYTWSNKDRSLQSRIDFWLVSSDLENKVESIAIEPTVLTDHNAVTIKINMGAIEQNFNRDYWKLNNNLLQSKEFQKEAQRTIDKHWKQARLLSSYSKYWELMKFEIRNLAILIGKKISRTNKKKESQVVAEIIKLSSKSTLSVEEMKDLTTAQTELDKIYEEKAKGAFVRSRRRWLEEGEKCTKYFFNLEKRNYEQASFSKLRVNDVICENEKEISQHVTKFYETLYNDDSVDQDNIAMFLKGLEPDIKKIDDNFKLICDQKILVKDVQTCIKALKDNKSPGNDGLTGEFYKVFSKTLAPFLTAMFEEALEKEELPPTLKQGLIKLIPKPNKDKLNIENWRPISLLNNDAKIFASVFAKRLKLGLDDIIDEEQSGFIPGRNIVNNIRLVLDMIDYSWYIPDDSFILFVDFYKAFDTVNHQFMIRTIEFFGFGGRFQKAIKTLYKGCNSSVKLACGTTPRFCISRGIRQGCPLSPFLFLLVTQVMAAHIKKNTFRGINALNKEFKLAQLADDTTIFLRDRYEISKAIECIDEFSQVSGLKMNLNKSVLLPIKGNDLSELNGIPVKNTVTYLGVHIDKNETNRCSLNFDPIIQQITKRFNMWLMRDLSLSGRVLLAKAEGISRSVYVSLSLEMPPAIYKKLDKTVFNFIWKNKCHYIKKQILCNPKSKGGMDVLSFETLNNTFKVQWLANLIKGRDCIWNIFPNYVFNEVGGINLLLKCNYKIEKIPIKLSNFHRQALLAWKLIYKHNFSPTNFCIWNNENILYKNKSLFYKNWFDHGIIHVKQLFNDGGQLLSYQEFLNKFQLPVPPKEFAVVIDALPRGVLQLYKCSGTRDLTLPPAGTFDNSVFVGEVDIIKKKCSNKYIRNCMLSPWLPSGQSFWSSCYGDISWPEAWMAGEKLCLNNKVKEVSFKILHKIYPTQMKLARFNIENDLLCKFCGKEEETIRHLFCQCVFSKIFWTDVQHYLRTMTRRTILLQEKDILILFKRNLDDDTTLFVRLILMLGKFHIHKKKWTNSKPNTDVFLLELQQYAATIKDCKNKKAIRTSKVLDKFNL